ncbi:hypothetical protein HanIR_Chr06g0275031 [Helianthus annuus]|nr:hypothetical protein HanIR_Chr06g0275031 [Helianthus annuus]
MFFLSTKLIVSYTWNMMQAFYFIIFIFMELEEEYELCLFMAFWVGYFNPSKMFI